VVSTFVIMLSLKLLFEENDKKKLEEYSQLASEKLSNKENFKLQPTRISKYYFQFGNIIGGGAGVILSLKKISDFKFSFIEEICSINDPNFWLRAIICTSLTLPWMYIIFGLGKKDKRIAFFGSICFGFIIMFGGPFITDKMGYKCPVYKKEVFESKISKFEPFLDENGHKVTDKCHNSFMKKSEGILSSNPIIVNDLYTIKNILIEAKNSSKKVRIVGNEYSSPKTNFYDPLNQTIFISLEDFTNYEVHDHPFDKTKKLVSAGAGLTFCGNEIRYNRTPKKQWKREYSLPDLMWKDGLALTIAGEYCSQSVGGFFCNKFNWWELLSWCLG